MKTVLYYAALMSLFCTYAQGASLEVTVKDVQKNKGSILISLCHNQECHDNIDNSPEKQEASPAISRKIPATNSRQIITTFSDLPAGDYSVFVLDDVNVQ